MPERYIIPYIDKILYIVGTFVFILVGLSACGSSTSLTSSTPTPIHPGPITIGASLSLTGGFAADGQATEQGYQLWVDNINKSGGILGHQVKLDILDDDTRLNQLTTNYQTLITVHHDDLVVGPFADNFTLAAARVATRYGYALVEGSGTAPVVFQAHMHNLFSVSLSAQNTLSSFATYILSLSASTRPTTAVYATEQDSYLQPIVETARGLLEHGGVKTSIDEITYPSETTDWNPIADKIIAANPDIVVLGTATNDAVAFVQRFKQQHFNPRVLLEVSGPDQGVQFTGPIGGARVAEGIFVPNGGWFPGLSTFQNTEFQQQYIARFGGSAATIGGDEVQAYSVLQVLKQAIDKAQSIDNARLIQILRTNTFQSVQGPVRFNNDGENMLATAYLFQWQNGNLTPVYPAIDALNTPEYPKPNWPS
ncbi:MAG TPA: amino acid ABC transporter substrate-binding protein [Ktedonobacteraceae bacterium]|nr:amino acid ABC transporter substrate-binding protein [Ktedonobacteraceae bacterium]